MNAIRDMNPKAQGHPDNTKRTIVARSKIVNKPKKYFCPRNLRVFAKGIFASLPNAIIELEKVIIPITIPRLISNSTEEGSFPLKPIFNDSGFKNALNATRQALSPIREWKPAISSGSLLIDMVYAIYVPIKAPAIIGIKTKKYLLNAGCMNDAQRAIPIPSIPSKLPFTALLGDARPLSDRIKNTEQTR